MAAPDPDTPAGPDGGVHPAPATDADTEFGTAAGNTASPDDFATFVPDSAPGQYEVRYDALVRGDQIGDFRIQRLLGRGSFGAVYLARELTLDRLVALKVVLPHGQSASAGEGRSLARLKHPNIVGVYGEALDHASGCSLLWMQFVDGNNLAGLISQLHSTELRETWSEQDLLRLMGGGESGTLLGIKAPGSMESVCAIGEKLARALEHAHQRGFVHRDIKPANILIDRDGTAYLADFNMAETQDACATSGGGTIAYMAPEQLGHLLREPDTPEVSPRSDLYSLGVVLWEFVCGQRPLQDAESTVVAANSGDRLKQYLGLRRRELDLHHPSLPLALALVLRRALMPNPSQRFGSAQGMATALRGLSQLQQARRRSPSLISRFPALQRNLFWLILLGGLLPHFAASALQSAYNQATIQGISSDAFTKAFVAYNIVVYPACISWLALKLYRFRKGYQRLVGEEPMRRSEVRQLRHRLLKLPAQFMAASAVGWFPGALLFPLLLDRFGGNVSTGAWIHYGVSFFIAGMIAATYSYAIVLYTVVCCGYGFCWQTAGHYLERARYELSKLGPRIRGLSIWAGILPLAAAALLMMIEIPTAAEAERLWSLAHAEAKPEFVNRVSVYAQLDKIVIGLIVFGAIGLYVVDRASQRMLRTVRALTLAEE